MNFIPLPRNDDVPEPVALALLIDMQAGDLIENLAQLIEAHFALPASRRDPLTVKRAQSAMVAASHIRNLIAPQMLERAP